MSDFDFALDCTDHSVGGAHSGCEGIILSDGDLRLIEDNYTLEYLIDG